MEDIIKDLKTLEFEIGLLKSQTAQNIIEIGKRLIEAKNQVPHGQWLDWLKEKVGFTERSAQKFIQIASDPNTKSISHLGVTKVFDLLSLQPEERNRLIETHDVEDMTTRELREEIKKNKQLEEVNARLLEDLGKAQQSAADKEIVEVEVIKEVVPSDYLAVKQKAELVDQLKIDTDKRTKVLEAELLKRDKKITSLEIAQTEALNKLPETEQKNKIINDAWEFTRAVEGFIKEVGGLVYLTQSIADLPKQERMYYERSIENIWAWANQIKFNLEQEVKHE